MLRFELRFAALVLPVFAACGEGSHAPVVSDSSRGGSHATHAGTTGRDDDSPQAGADGSRDDMQPSEAGETNANGGGNLNQGGAVSGGGANGGSANNSGSANGGSVGACGSCDSARVCCEQPLPCAGQCVPDCRLGTACPNGLTCDASSGVCNSGAGNTGGASGAGGAGTAGGGAANGGSAMAGAAGMMSGGMGGAAGGGAGTGQGGMGGSSGMGGSGGKASGGSGGKASGGSGGKGSGGGSTGSSGSGGSDGGATNECFDSLPPTGSGQAEEKLGATNTWAAFFGGRNGMISGHTAVLGSEGNPLVVGKATIFQWNDCTSAWEMQQLVVGSDTKADEYFGGTVDLEGDSLVVGASYRGGLAGGAYTFTRSGTTWTQGQILSAPTSAARFGYAIAQSGATMAISAPLGKDPLSSITYSGEVYIYTRGPGSKWTYQAMLSPAEIAQDDLYGYTLEFDSGTLVAGAPGRAGTGAFNQGKTPGKAWVWTGSGSTWTQGAYLTPPDGQVGDSFGNAVTMEGDTIVVGAPYHDSAAVNAGAVYIFTKTGNAWVQTGKLTASDATSDAQFGYSATFVSSTHLLVGAPGAAKLYSFTYSGSSWTEDAGKYTACSNGILGHNVTASGGLALSSQEGGWVFDLSDPDKSCVGP